MRNGERVARAGQSAAPTLRLDLGEIQASNLDACARVLARLAVEKALQELGLTVPLDTGPTTSDDAVNQHKEAPASVSAPTEAKEQVE